jgi:FSR family fosmidomycin resistance protein-like MFS transporter
VTASKTTGSKTGFSPFLVLGHLVNDASSNLLTGLLPAFTGLFGLSYLLAGLVAMVFNTTSSILQPLLGRWFDRTQASWLLEAGIAVNCIAMSLTGIAPNYTTLLLLVGIAGLGSAGFHPPSFSAVVRSGGPGRGRAMGIFLSGGNTGFFLGPLVAGLMVSALGLPGSLLLLPIGALTAVLLFRIRVGDRKSALSPADQAEPANKRLIALLAAITALRSIAIQSIVTFLPLYFVAEGDSLLTATAIVSLWLGIGVLGQLGGGYLSDHVGRRPVIVVSLLAGGLSFYGFLSSSGLVSVLLLALSGCFLYASWSVIVVMSSEAAPSNVGAVTGFMLGFSVGVGGFGALGFGGAADILGLNFAFTLIIASVLAGGLMGLLLPRAKNLSTSKTGVSRPVRFSSSL